jgi:hypothetical protein
VISMIFAAWKEVETGWEWTFVVPRSCIAWDSVGLNMQPKEKNGHGSF